jgi:transposase
MQTKLRTYEITPNDNICFPIGTMLAVENLYEELNLSSTLGKHKSKGIDFNSLIKALLSYKLTENFSVDRALKWIIRMMSWSSLVLENLMKGFCIEPFRLWGAIKKRLF